MALDMPMNPPPMTTADLGSFAEVVDIGSRSMSSRLLGRDCRHSVSSLLRFEFGVCEDKTKGRPIKFDLREKRARYQRYQCSADDL